MRDFLRILGSRGAKILPLKSLALLDSGRLHLGLRNVISFGFFTPLAQILLKNITNKIILHPCSIEGVDSCKYEISSEHGVSALLAYISGSAEFQDIDLGYVSSECNVAEEELEEVKSFLNEGCVFVLGRDLFLHKSATFIAYALSGLASYFFVEDLREPLVKSSGEIVDYKLDLSVLDCILEQNGAFIYECDFLTLESTNLQGLDVASLIAPPSFVSILKVESGKDYQLRLLDGRILSSRISINKILKGVIGLFNRIPNDYPFKQVSLLNNHVQTRF